VLRLAWIRDAGPPKPEGAAQTCDDTFECAMSIVQPRRSLGIQARLVVLVLVTVLPLVALSSFAILRTVDNERSRIERDVRERVESLLADVDREIRSVQVSLQILASSPNLQSGDMAAFASQIREALKVQGLAIGLHDATAEELVSTTRPYGELPARKTNRETVDRVVRTGKPHISNLFTGTVLQRPILTVGVPVFRDDKVIYVLTMALDPAHLSAVLQDQNIPFDWTAGIFDRKGIIVARNRDLDRFFGHTATATLRERMAGAVEGWFPNVTSEGMDVYAAFRRSLITGWTVAIGIPKVAMDAPLRRAYWLALGGGTATLALSLALAWWMARAIRRPVEALTAATQALGSGEPLGPLLGGVRELDQVGDALSATAVVLTRTRAELEVMVGERTQELARANERLTAEIGAREQAQTALLQAQKMEAMGQLTGGIAHDFNNLLTAASGSLELLETRISDERGLRLLQTAQRAMARGAKLTGSLLAFARKQRLEPVLGDVNSIVIEVTDLLCRSIGPTIEVRHTLASPLWPTLVDTSQIGTALLNVAINARDAMPPGGVLLIKTANIRAGVDDMPEEVVGHDCVLVSMTDTGSGMSPEVLEHAFEPFFTTKEIGKGTGLGLSTVFGIVRQSGGAIRIRSRVGEGTTVEIYLPRAKRASMSSAKDPLPGRARTSAGARILVVDDDADVRWVTVDCLREIGHFVAEADSGRAALTILERGDPCDLLVIDVVMPGLSGRDAVRLARRARSDLKVLFVTGYADKFGFEDDGVGDPLIKKPFKPADLADAVRQALLRAPVSKAGNIEPLRRRKTAAIRPSR
jgi:signal transduction histidine kinase/CheY-like chemotaxis protein